MTTTNPKQETQEDAAEENRELVKSDTPKPLAPLVGVAPRTVDEAGRLAAMLAKAGCLPRALQSKPADVFAVVLAGAELGLPPMAAIRGVHMIEGKPTLSADLIVGLVRRSALCKSFRVVESTSERCVVETLRAGDTQPQRETWTLEDAQRAGLGGANWKKYPKAMLVARAKAALARRVYEDLVGGCYLPDELLEELADAPPPVAADSDPLEGEPQPKPDDLEASAAEPGSEPDPDGPETECRRLHSDARFTITDEQRPMIWARCTGKAAEILGEGATKEEVRTAAKDALYEALSSRQLEHLSDLPRTSVDNLLTQIEEELRKAAGEELDEIPF